MEDINFLLNKAYFYLKFRLRTEKELRNYLIKKIKDKHWSLDDVEKVINILKDQGLIDDEKFIKAYINDRNNFKPKGKKLLIKELKQKGIKEDLLEKYFSENELDEEELAFEVLKKRWSKLNRLDEKKRSEKAIRLLLSRGFSFETAKKTYKKLKSSIL